MGWLRSAMHKAAEVRGKSGFRAAVRSYAGNTVAGTAKKSQERVPSQSIKSYKEEVKKLEEVSVSSKGEERVQLLKRWLVSLRETERPNADSVENDEKSSEEPHKSSDKNDSSGTRTVVLYHDPDHGVSPIVGAPNEEEILLLCELFGLCLTGGKEVHDAIVKRIQDLAKAFSVYDDEVLAKRGELLQFAQDAISGLKVNADILRIDSEVSQIHQNLKKLEQKKLSIECNDSSPDATDEATLEVIKESVAPIQLCCKLESLLRKKRLLKNGDTPETHAHKVDKLKILSESLLGSASKTEKRIADHRQQKEEALHFRVAKTSEVSQIEKDLGAEISVLEKQRDELEAELKKVESSLAVANAHLQNAKEEREQFDDASNELLVHFKAKEDELSKAIASYRAEADTCSAFVGFLEAAWAFQFSYVEQKDKKVNDELENHEEYFVNVAKSLLSAYKDALAPAMTILKQHMKNLKRYEKAVDPDEEFLQDIERRKSLEQAYLAAETKLETIFEAVESVKEQFYGTIDHVSRKNDEPVNELCDAIEKIKGEFESLARPNLRSDKPAQGEQIPAKESPKKGVSPTSKRVLAADIKSIFTQKLVTRPQKNKPYIPLGGSAENSPSNVKDDTKPVENEQHKTTVKEGDKEPSKTTLKIDNKSIEHPKETSDVKKTDQVVNKEPPESKVELEKENESQESNMSRSSSSSSSEDEKVLESTNELESLGSEKDGTNPETEENEPQICTSDGEKTTENEREKTQLSMSDGENPAENEREKIPRLSTSDGENPAENEREKTRLSTSDGENPAENEREKTRLSTSDGEKPAVHEREKTAGLSISDGEKPLDSDNEIPNLATGEETEAGGNTERAKTEESKISQSSSSESGKSSDDEEEPPKPKDEHSIE